jgi:transposase InsO family protein/transposase-like protein
MADLNRKAKDFTKQERDNFLEQYQKSGLTHAEFAREHNIHPQTMNNWVWLSTKPDIQRRRFSPTERKKIVESFLAAKMSLKSFGKTWGVNPSTLSKWVESYSKEGSDGLMNKGAVKNDDKRVGTRIPSAVQEAIVKIKKESPDFGIQKVADFLYRFRGMKISRGSIRKTMKLHNIAVVKVKRKKKRSSERVRRFERAKPMQLWQSDITQFTLGQYWSRVYLTVFMDDHSRFIVGWRLQSRQTAELVIDAFKDACVQYGKPSEVLTDQGRQYFAWRGKSELEKLLERESIKHVVSRAHHPQTLGKCERFWETVANEFWSRVKPQELEEARIRLKHFIDHYNYQRPHQGIDGQVPADRFFGVAAEVREAVEKSVERNALAMAIGEIPKPPAFLIGQIGDQRIAFHGTSGRFYLTHENLDGEMKNESGRSDQANKNESAQDKDIEVSGGANAGFMGAGEHGGARIITDASAGDFGLLDGSQNEKRGSGSFESEASEILAINGSGCEGDGCRVTVATP